jgi:hypothetical protein
MAPEGFDRPPPVEPDAIHAGAPRPRPGADAITDRPQLRDSSPLPEEPQPVALVRSTAYFGRELREHSAKPILGGLFALLGAALVALSWNYHIPRLAGVLAPVCFLLAWACFRSLVFPGRFQFGEDGIACTRPRRFVSYSDIRDVFPMDRGAGDQFPIHLLLGDDSVLLPARLGIPSAELVEFLRSQPLGPRNTEEVPPLFANFFKQQLLVSPQEQIYIFRGNKRRVSPRTRRYRTAAWWFISLSAIWFALTPLDVPPPIYPPFGALAGLFGLIFLVGGYTPMRHGQARIKNWQDVTLIITPLAMALQQGDLRGELRWEELLSLSSSNRRRAAPKNLARLTLKVRGASIQLFDIYQWPLDCAADLIARYSRK